MRFWPRKKTPEEQKAALITKAVKKLDWHFAEDSGWAFVSSKLLDNPLFLKCQEQGLTDLVPIGAGRSLLAAVDPELEAAINKKKGFSAHAAADKAAQEQRSSSSYHPAYDQDRKSGEQLRNSGDQREGLSPS